MTDVFLASACRTGIGRFQGSLSGFRAPELGAFAISEALSRAGLDGLAVDEVIMGNVLQAGVGQNPARQAARAAGIPDSVAPFTVNKVCGSGLKSVMLAAQSIKAGDNHVVVAGGMESMSNAPYLMPSARQGARLGHAQLLDSMVHDGLWDAYSDQHMGMTGELVADEYNISREMQDEFAASSHRKAGAAWESGKFAAETFEVSIPQRKKDPIAFAADEGVRGDTTAEGIGKMRPAFKKDGSVTAGNASQLSDGASAVVVASAEACEKHGLNPLAKITGYSAGGMAPEWVMMAPKVAIENLEARTGLNRNDFDLIELNEAFSSAACALTQEMKLDPERINVNGGAVALGHPIGASGARILTTLLYALKDRNLQRGLAALCLGGGNAVSLSVELC
ncbi:MAG TPA: acetyl-CoA C-acetyltransferase [Planctomycetota bacterium]|jgi:acetyl-CoA C-acetyltransferase|nr:acetyl-CoA C-acetyltransferase [Planctomycetota bacterium]HJM40335.1 acetyl-CoA C-acetyltransferase [Planctomycetota bacterium]|tara:strand:+ start:16659 stop:17840 length:1182 start_codon:yes stop_codon:yes gene_type:complete